MLDMLYLYPMTADLKHFDIDVLFIIRKDLIYPGRDHPFCTAHPDCCDLMGSTREAWFRIQDDEVFPTSANPCGISDQPHFRFGDVQVDQYTFRGLVTAKGHPSGIPDIPAFVIR